MKQTMISSLTKALKRGWMTPLDALFTCGCLSLSQRCGDLRMLGVPVVDKWVHLASGKKVKAYRILKTKSPINATARG